MRKKNINIKQFLNEIISDIPEAHDISGLLEKYIGEYIEASTEDKYSLLWKIQVISSFDSLNNELKEDNSSSNEFNYISRLSSWPEQIRSKYPKHSSQPLLILGWAGKIHPEKKYNLGKVTDLNPAFRNFLDQNESELYTAFKEDQLETSELLKHIISNTREEQLYKELFNKIHSAARGYNDYFKQHEFNSENFTRWEKSNGQFSAEIGEFTITPFAINQQDNVIMGCRIDKAKGVDYKTSNKSHFFDPFIVFHFSDDKRKIIGAQGVFVPVDNRNKVFNNYSRQSTLNAIAVVMARNMSHNIGSHVLSRLVSPNNIDINTLTTGTEPFYFPFDETKHYLKKIDEKKKAIKNNNDGISSEKALKQAYRHYYNELIANFFSYLKTRQDLLADIVSGVPQVQSAKWFKGEIMEGLDLNRILLNRISGVEDFKFTFQFEGKIKEQDLQVAVSNDVMGEHAFYIILENIIRNSAKHGQAKSEEYVFTIRVEESCLDTSLYQVTIFDNIQFENNDFAFLKFNKTNQVYKSALNHVQFDIGKKYKDYRTDDSVHYEEFTRTEWIWAFIQTLKLSDLPDHGKELNYLGSDESFDYFKIKKIDKLIINQNIWLNSKVLDKDLNLRPAALGLIEMACCSSYLRRIPLENIESSQFELKFSREELIALNEQIENDEKEPRILMAINPRNNYPDTEKKVPVLNVNGTSTNQTHKIYRNLNNSPRTNTLGYRFYIPKPKELLIVDEAGDLWKQIQEKAEVERVEQSDNALVQKCIEYLTTFESHGILIVFKSDNVPTKFRKNRTLAKWFYNHNKVYQQELMILVSKKYMEDVKKELYKDLSNLDDDELEHDKAFFNLEYKLPYLPSCIISQDYFTTHFMDYFGANKKKYLDYFYSLEDQSCFITTDQNNQISTLDFIDKPDLLLTEAWRAYTHHKLKNKGIRYSDDEGGNCDDLREAIMPLPESNMQFVFVEDHHGDDYKELEDAAKCGSITVYESKHEEVIRKHSKEIKIYNKNNDIKNIVPFFKRVDDQTSNILILDERIQEQVYANTYDAKGGSYTYAQLWDECNVHIPPANPSVRFSLKTKPHYKFDWDINLSAPKFDITYPEKIVDIINKRFIDTKENSKTLKGLDYLVIHVGIVEKMMAFYNDYSLKDPKQISRFIHNEILGKFESSHTKVILTSGRGPSANTLPKDIPFLSYSVIAQYLIENRLKLYITNVLKAARPKLNI